MGDKMILINLVKKEIIHFFRNKANILTMLLFPVILITVMGAALEGLMSTQKEIFNKDIVYYKLNHEDKVFLDFKNKLEEEMKLKFLEIDVDNKEDDIIKEKVNNNEAILFITINDEQYSVYKNPKKNTIKSQILINLLNTYIQTYSTNEVVLKENPSEFKDNIEKENLINIEDNISNNKVDSYTYYTFAILVLIILYISSITSTSTYNEGFLRTNLRLNMAKVNPFYIILSKVALGIIIGSLQILTVYIISKNIFKVEWGENLVYILIVLLALIVFSSVLGIVATMVFEDSKASSSFINIVIVVLGFLGGSYMPIVLIKSVEATNILSSFTPTYWANISILTLSLGMDNNYYYKSIALSLGLSFILMIIGIVVSKIKGRC